jgi:hypothetical protein
VSEEVAVKFRQTIEFTTDRIDEFTAYFDDWIARSEGDRIPHRAVLQADRDAPGVYLLTVEFLSHEQGMANSRRSRTAEFATFLGGLAEGPLGFRNLAVLREEEL